MTSNGWLTLPLVPCWASVGVFRFFRFSGQATLQLSRPRLQCLLSEAGEPRCFYVVRFIVRFPPDVHQAVALSRLVRKLRAGAVAYYLGHLAESAFSF
jgi:hypothetical protein